MARPRKPTAVLELTGAFEKDPQRKRPHEPKPTSPLGDPPESFQSADGLTPDKTKEREELTAIWFELSAMVPPKVLTNADRWLVELACRAMYSVRKGTSLLGERNFLISCLSRMGLTPADRSKIGVPQEEKELDELAQLAAECRPAARKPN